MRDHEQTELAPVETETAAVRAWGLAEDYEDDPPAARFNPRAITTAAVAASLVAITVAWLVAWQHLRSEDEPVPTDTTSSMVPAVVPPPLTTSATPIAAPPPSPPSATGDHHHRRAGASADGEPDSAEYPAGYCRFLPPAVVPFE
jgi:hypothetical protein